MIAVKRIKSCFHKEGEAREKVWGTSLLPQIVLICLVKPISSGSSLRYDNNFLQRSVTLFL